MLSCKLTLPLPMGFGSFLCPFLWDCTRLGVWTPHVQPQNLPGLQAILYLVIAVCSLVAAASLHLSNSLQAIEDLLQHPAPQLLVPKLLSGCHELLFSIIHVLLHKQCIDTFGDLYGSKLLWLQKMLMFALNSLTCTTSVC